MTMTAIRDLGLDLEDPENTATSITVEAADSATGSDVRRTAEEVRQGHTGDHLRGILAVSLIGVVALFLTVYLVFAR